MGGMLTSGLESRLRDTVRGRVDFSAAARGLYSMDASNYRKSPIGVLTPESVEDVVAAVAAAREFDVPLVPRGGGTSVSGNSIGGLVLDFSKHLNHVLEVDPESRLARVEPGVVLDDLRAAAAPYGLTFGPDPSTHSRCTLGGMIGNNACGSHSVRWGKTADNVHELEVLRYDGSRVVLGPESDDEVHRKLRALAEGNLAVLRQQFPPMPRRVSGYALDELLPEHGFSVLRSFVGTEGTCATLLGATVKLVPTPAAKALLVLGFADDVAAADAVPDLLDYQLLTIEGMDRRIVQLTGASVELPPGDAWLFIEVGGADLGEATDAARKIATAHSGHHRLVIDAAEQRLLWKIREEGAGLSTRRADGSEAWPGWEDAAVPPQNLGAYLRDFRTLLADHNVDGISYGHFGEGCIHARIDFDLISESGLAKFRSFIEGAADLVVAHGGSLSGEHGDGLARSELLSRMYSPEVIELFGQYKAIWDPSDKMNPGVIVRPGKIDEHIRFAGARIPLRTAFSFPHDDGNFAQAMRRCVGVGKCRNSHTPGGVMCPSYQVTREEKHSTRGRARLLLEMLRGEVITDGWRSTEVRDALDLCLSCKGCKSDCPVDVDMATYKAEFLHHHYAGRVRPAAHYSMGYLPLMARLASAAPGLVNGTARSPLAGLLKRAGGIAPERKLPTFADEPFVRWFRRRTRAGAERRPPVLLWPDTFDNYFTPEVARAATEVLEDAGFTVVVPDAPVCCGLTWVSTGQLDVAKRVMKRTLAALAPYMRAGMPIVGLEPSCTAALRSDLVELVPGAASEQVAAATRTLAEVLDDSDWNPPQLSVQAIKQTHCHQHAVLGSAADTRLMSRAGINAQTLDSGCCGLAGNFGFERGHYEVSKAIGEQVLLPAVRAADRDTEILADGFSCRTQIAQQTDRRAVHLAQLLRRAVDLGRP